MSTHKPAYFATNDGERVSPLIWYRPCPSCATTTEHVVVSAEDPYLVCHVCKMPSKVDIIPIP